MTPLDKLHQRMIDFQQITKLVNVSPVLYFEPDEWRELMNEPATIDASFAFRGDQVVAMFYAGFTLRLAK